MKENFPHIVPCIRKLQLTEKMDCSGFFDIQNVKLLRNYFGVYFNVIA